MFKNNFAFFVFFSSEHVYELHRDGLVIVEERVLTNVKSSHDHGYNDVCFNTYGMLFLYQWV